MSDLRFFLFLAENFDEASNEQFIGSNIPRLKTLGNSIKIGKWFRILKCLVWDVI